MNEKRNSVRGEDGKEMAKRVLLEEDYACTLCLKLLYRPTTTICGHSFCQECLSRSLKHRAKCPICRSVLHASPDRLSISTDLARLLENAFPEEYKARTEEALALERLRNISKFGSDMKTGGAEEESTIPCFVLCPLLPRQRLHLHIYEPRYRLMTQRCLEGSRRFGIVAQASRGSRAPYSHGTEVQIVECESLPGGRFYLEVVGIRVFQILDTWETDQYLTCKVRWISLDEETPSQALVQKSHALEELVEEWQTLVYERGFERSTDQLRRLFRDIGHMPDASKPGDRAMWIAALINPIPALGVAPEIRLTILKATTSEERVDMVTEALKSSMLYMKPTVLRSILMRGWSISYHGVSFLLRHSWLIILGYWLAQRFPNSVPLSRSSLLFALRITPPM